MQEERNYLVKYVFPDLRKRCRERGVEFVEVDLRWGITKEQSEKGEVLPICLAEIEKCHPYFIGLLGERYGWVPDKIDEELQEVHPWLKEHVDHSVTELEILHGVLRNPKMADHSFFYFRYPGYVENVPAEQKQYFFSESSGATEKLKNLKQRIKDSGLPLKEKYRNPKEVGTLILKDLWQAIDSEFPKGSELSPLNREILDHWVFGESRARVYIGRQKYYERLDCHVNSEAPPLVVLGESGSGKSALLANWVKCYQNKHPNDFLLTHYLGATADSADYAKMLWRIMSEIKRHCNSTDDIPTDNEKIRQAFPNWLATAAAKGRFILVIDALNQLDDMDNAPDLGWLPTYFPANVRSILSTLPGRSLTALVKREWPTLTVEPLQPEERRKVIEDYLAVYGKGLSGSPTDHLLQAEQTGNPLYLRTLLNELRVFGSHEELDNRINHYLQAATIQGLFAKVLERLEHDYDKTRKGLVREVFSLIYASRRGLAETELLEILGERDKPLPRAVWSPLFLAAEDMLINRSGLLAFFHDYMRQSVERRYLKTVEHRKGVHLRLADYFEKRELDDRKVDEYPWQLLQVPHWKRLRDCLVDLEIFGRLFTADREFELLRYWRDVSEQYDMVKAYQSSFDTFEKQKGAGPELGGALDAVAGFLALAMKHEAAEGLYRRALSIRQECFGRVHPDTSTTCNNLALLLTHTGNYSEAESFYRRVMEAEKLEPALHSLGYITTLNNFAILLELQGKYREAEEYNHLALKFAKMTHGPNHPDTANCLNAMGSLYCKKGEHQKAEKYLRHALRIREMNLGPDHLAVAATMNSLAVVLKSKNEYGEAENLLNNAIEIANSACGPQNPLGITARGNLALLFSKQGKSREAVDLAHCVMREFEEVLGADHPDSFTTINNLAGVLEDHGDMQKAEEFYRQALAASESKVGSMHPAVAQVKDNLAGLLEKKGDLRAAAKLREQAVAVMEQYPDNRPSDQVNRLNRLVSLWEDLGEEDKSVEALRKLLSVWEKSPAGNDRDKAANMSNLALKLKKRSRYEEAESIFRAALETLRKCRGTDDPDTLQVQKNIASLLFDRGDLTGAREQYSDLFEKQKQKLGEDHPDVITTMSQVGAVAKKLRDWDFVISILRRTIHLRRNAALTDDHHFVADLYNLAVALQARAEYDEAKDLYSEALPIVERIYGPENYRTLSVLNGLESLRY